MNWKVLMNGIWEMAKDALCQRIIASHLPAHPSLPNLSGRSCIVTGATSGIGLHTARELAMAGAHVIMACRNTRVASELDQEWQRQQKEVNGNPLSIEVMELELMCLASVKAFAANLLSRRAPLHILINNAGIYRMGEPQKFTRDGNEQHMQVNHLGGALLTILLLPLLLRGAPSRIVNVNSVAHYCAIVDPQDLNHKNIKKNTFNSITAYGSSKLAHLMFLSVLSSKLPETAAIDVIAVHPGIVSTNLVGDVVASFRNKSFWKFNAAEGARSVIFCATAAELHDDKELHGNDKVNVKGESTAKFAYYSYNCRPAKISTQATDSATAIKIWEKTLELLGLSAASIENALDQSHISPFYRLCGLACAKRSAVFCVHSADCICSISFVGVGAALWSVACWVAIPWSVESPSPCCCV
eukprot:Gb_19713 [translate_table: standard]